MGTRTALLVGATGLVGRHCLDRLLAHPDYGRVTVLGRRPLERSHPKLIHHVIDFDRPDAYAPLVQAHDVFCCLGTTMKQAGSKAAFRRVDYQYPLDVAKHAAANGADQYLLVSALGADPDSHIFYNRVKGEVEAAVREVPLHGVYILRPSLLTGERDQSRIGEQVGEAVLKAVSFALRGPLRKLHPIEAATVARALVALAIRRPGGVRVFEPEAIREAAHEGGMRGHG